MTPEAQRIAIAEACGFTRYNPNGLRSGDMREWNPPKEDGPLKAMFFANCGELPDFLNELNACHEMVASQSWDADDMLRYENALHSIVAPHYTVTAPLYVWCMMHATAKQRCEAFLRAIGKWVES